MHPVFCIREVVVTYFSKHYSVLKPLHILMEVGMLAETLGIFYYILVYGIGILAMAFSSGGAVSILARSDRDTSDCSRCPLCDRIFD